MAAGNIRRPVKWTLEACMLDAQKYTTKQDWRKASPIAIRMAYRRGWLEQCCRHMVRFRRDSSDLTRWKFGEWTVLGLARHSRKNTYWNVRCECGEEKEVRGGALTAGHSKSCLKCAQRLRRERGVACGKKLEDRTQALLNTVYSVYRSSAKKSGRQFDISKEAFFSLIYSQCFYCGVLPNRPLTDRATLEQTFVLGVDRLDSRKGYIAGNCVACCTVCNKMKNVLSVGEFLDHVAKIHARSPR